jgi:hypothetical protein
LAGGGFVVDLFDISAVWHRIRVKLYPSRLARFAGKYLARTVSERMLTIEDICAAAKERDGYAGTIEDMIKYTVLFLDEAFYQLGNGFAVNLKYFSAHINVGGVFDRELRGVPPVKPEIGCRFRARAPLRRLEKRIEVYVVGAAGSGAYIDEFYDFATETTNKVVSPGEAFLIVGGKIKVVGDRDKTGVYFTSQDDTVKVTGNLLDNQRAKIIGRIPPLPPGKVWTLEVRTQYTSSGNPLKEVRVIQSEFTLTS